MRVTQLSGWPERLTDVAGLNSLALEDVARYWSPLPLTEGAACLALTTMVAAFPRTAVRTTSHFARSPDPLVLAVLSSIRICAPFKRGFEAARHPQRRTVLASCRQWWYWPPPLPSYSTITSTRSISCSEQMTWPAPQHARPHYS